MIDHIILTLSTPHETKIECLKKVKIKFFIKNLKKFSFFGKNYFFTAPM